MKKIILIFIVIIAGLQIFSQQIEIPALERRVTDLTGTLTENEILAVENLIVEFEKTNASQIAVLMIPTTGEETIEQYSIRVAEQWKIGNDEYNDGVILIIAKDDRTLRIEVGYGLEAVITDAQANIIINEYILPNFKNGEFYLGIYSGVSNIINLINGGELISTNTAQNIDKSKSEKKSNFLIVVSIFLSFLLSFGIFLVYKKKMWILIITILSVLLIGSLVGLLTKMYILYLFTLGFPGFFGVVAIFLKTQKIEIGGSSNSSSDNSYSYQNFDKRDNTETVYSMSNSSSESKSYSGKGGKFGGGGASGKW